ncbi:hypothetical protein RAB80_004253 [Fusarium oxysporum f. sp. vasinfectum]|nr:hypothetical protein RAB80_004253 [Fusarium oxysporum f. sp. vasinfectum]
MSQQPPIRPEQGSYTEFQLETSHLKPPHKRDKDILAKLRDSVPQNETQWQQARQLHRYATAEHVFQKTKDILENRIAKQDLRNFMSIATCCVYWHLNRKKDAYDYFKLQIGQATELTIQRYMSSVRSMVQAMNPLYLRGLKHRVFEAILLYSRISPSFLTYYTKDIDAFNSCFPNLVNPEPETQASLALSPAFILKYQHPEHSYRDICQALGITVLDEEAYANFVSVLDSGRPVPYILPLPEQVAPAAPSSHDTLALRDGFASLFKAFDTSETLQKLVEEVRDVVDHQRRWEVPNTPLLELQWTLHYDVVVDQLVGHLIQQGILPRQPFHRYKSFYQHESGSISVSPGWVKIILPALVDDACQVSIAGPMLEEQDFIWDYKMGFILCESMRLSTPHTIFYFSVSIPITSDA